MDEKQFMSGFTTSMDYGELMTAHSNITKSYLRTKLHKVFSRYRKWANKKNITIISVNPKSIATKDVADVVINSIPLK